MKRIRATLVASTLMSALAFSGLAAAGPAPERAPNGGGVPHANPPVDDRVQHSDAPVKDAPVADQRALAVQRALADRNVYHGKIDGVWGAQTEAALRDFQRQNNLAVTGKLDAPTAEKLGLDADLQPVAGTDTPPPPRTTHVRKLAARDATEVQLSTLSLTQVKEMQERLQLLGYYRGPIDGTVGDGTRSALRQFFQRQAQLAANGQVSNATIGLFGTEPGDISVSK